MGLLLCMLAGGIAANMVASILPHRSIHGYVNIAFGLLAGAGVWSFVSDFATYPPTLSMLITMLAAGGLGGIIATLALGALRNMVFGQTLQS